MRWRRRLTALLAYNFCDDIDLKRQLNKILIHVKDEMA